jgi:hypothetical protein
MLTGVVDATAGRCLFFTWLHQRDADAIAALPRFNHDQRCRLAVLGHRLGRARVRTLASLATPDTILRRHCQLVARKLDYPRPRADWPVCGNAHTPIDVRRIRTRRISPEMGYCLVIYNRMASGSFAVTLNSDQKEIDVTR